MFAGNILSRPLDSLLAKYAKKDSYLRKVCICHQKQTILAELLEVCRKYFKPAEIYFEKLNFQRLELNWGMISLDSPWPKYAKKDSYFQVICICHQKADNYCGSFKFDEIYFYI